VSIAEKPAPSLGAGVSASPAGDGSFWWPLVDGAGKPTGRMTSGYGKRTAPTKGASSFHAAIDLAGDKPGMFGLDIVASKGGVVVFSGNKGGYGKTVQIRHPDGTLSQYAHCETLRVKEGDVVQQGQHIADMGSSGTSTGAHLDFKIQVNGKWVNPLNYINKSNTGPTVAALRDPTGYSPSGSGGPAGGQQYTDVQRAILIATLADTFDIPESVAETHMVALTLALFADAMASMEDGYESGSLLKKAREALLGVDDEINLNISQAPGSDSPRTGGLPPGPLTMGAFPGAARGGPGSTHGLVETPGLRPMFSGIG
jgi:hypothetical protein